MTSKPIDFREMLDRLLPLEGLPHVGRLGMRRSLRAGVSAGFEEAGLLALAQIERQGSPGTSGGGNWLAPEAPEIATAERDSRRGTPAAEAPAPTEREGILIYRRSGLPAQARGGLEQVGRLLRLDDPMLSSDPRRGHARMELIHQLNQAGHELLGSSALRFLPAVDEAEEATQGHLDPSLSREARVHPELLYYCPDTARAPRLAAAGRRRGLRSVVLAGVASARTETLGLLEVTSGKPDGFRLDELAMIALLADYWTGVLERAARIEKLVFIDPMTSAYNRSYFDLQLQNEMARAEREQNSMALCIADIDDFKSFNTRYGFESGNRVLVQVAQALRRGVRPFDTVARWGGEEFAVLLTAPVQAQDVVTVCERLRSTVERLDVQLESLERRVSRAPVTMSLGVALFPDHGRDPTDLWRAANQALLEAKRPPKNQVVFYRPRA